MKLILFLLLAQVDQPWQKNVWIARNGVSQLFLDTFHEDNNKNWSKFISFHPKIAGKSLLA